MLTRNEGTDRAIGRLHKPLQLDYILLDISLG